MTSAMTIQIAEAPTPGKIDPPVQAEKFFTSLPAKIVARQIEILIRHATTLALRVEAGQLGFIDAIDICYEAAVASGMAESVGDDQIQSILHDCFGPTRMAAGLAP